MAVEIITKQDLEEFRFKLIADIEKIIQSKSPQTKRWLKSKEVCKLLNISPGTLQNFRINGTLSYNKVGGIIFYSYDQIQKLMDSK